MARPRYAFVIPVFNEEQTLEELYTRLAGVMSRLDGDSEVIFVDDGSRDRTFELLLELNRRDPRIRVLRLARNFGHQTAITAGLDYSCASATIIMDADLQDPPEVALDLVARWREGYEIVYAVREQRLGDPWVKRALATGFYRFLRRVTDVSIPVDVGDFRLIDARVLNEFKGMRERNRYVRGMFAWIGFRQTGVPFKRHERFAGSTKYPFRKSLALALDGVLSFSNAPLRVALTFGFLVSGASVLVGLLAVIGYLTGLYAVVRGIASVVVLLTFLGGVQLVVVGMVGLYVGRMYDEVKGRPLYVLWDAYGFGSDTAWDPTPPARDEGHMHDAPA